MAFRSFDSAYNFRTVPSAASAGSVAPIVSRNGYARGRLPKELLVLQGGQAEMSAGVVAAPSS